MSINNLQVDQLLGYSAAGVTKKTSDIIDMSGYDGVLFIAELGTIIEDGTLDVFVDQNDADTTVGMARVATTTVHTVLAADAALAKSAIVVDVFKPQERYLQANITPAVSNAVILGITAIRYKTHLAPVANASLVKSTRLISPAEA